ncbi:hypothetical protein O9929_22375 [Vibrio lentus]|nr:hypothetical protein [Vibrio lentus]
MVFQAVLSLPELMHESVIIATEESRNRLKKSGKAKMQKWIPMLIYVVTAMVSLAPGLGTVVQLKGCWYQEVTLRSIVQVAQLSVTSSIYRSCWWVGIGALVAQSAPWAFTTIKWVGVAYLCGCIQKWRDNSSLRPKIAKRYRAEDTLRNASY